MDDGTTSLLHDLRVERWPLDRLRPAGRNPRTHSPAQIEKIARSLAEFGWTNPVLIDDAGGIIAGHGRVLAAKRLGMTEAPVIRLAHLSPAQRRAYALADNRLALDAGWDEGLLALELGELKAMGVELELTGFKPGELEAWLGAPAREGLAEDDAAPEPPQVPLTRPGDLWRLGEHALLCGDATRAEDVARALAGEEAAMCFTDPPYNVDYRGPARGRRAIANDDLGEGFGAFLEAACRNILRRTAGAAYVCMSSSELHALQRAFAAAGGHWSTFIIWAKHAFTLGRADYQRSYEPILYGWREGARRHWCGARDQGDVWWLDKPAANDLHPTQKPVALVERALRNSSRAGDRVLDPFAGSGSTLIACARSGRRARLVELDPAYCDVVARRWAAWSGEPAVREADGARFGELAGE